MARFNLTRDSFIPANASKITDKRTGAVAYVADNGPAYFTGLGFAGKAIKPSFHFRFCTAAQREQHIRAFFAVQQSRAVAKAESTAKRDASSILLIGDILVSSWGYDQTNIDFYEVTQTAGQFVTIRKLRSASQETDSMVGKCRPLPGTYAGEPMRKRVQWGDSVKIASYAQARKWNTGEVAGVKLGPTMNWTAYA